MFLVLIITAQTLISLFFIGKDVRRWQTENEQIREERLCIICLNNEKNVTLKCGHVACEECAKKLSRCHSCRKLVLDYYKYSYHPTSD